MNSLCTARFAAAMALALLALTGCAQPHVHSGSGSYAGQQSRDIKALSEEEVQGYLAGAGMGFARAAELNRYPGPMHALEHADALALSQGQRAALAQIGAAQARVRGSHLKTHIEATALMTPAQIERYARLRGY